MVKVISKYQNIIFLALLLLLLIGIYIYGSYEEHKDMLSLLYYANNEPVKANHTTGIYNNDIEVKLSRDLTIPNDAIIYYTLDGNDPTTTSDTYNNKIELKLTDKLTIYPLKYRILFKDELSDIFEQDYILVPKEKTVENIISITIDEKELYDEETGIFVEQNFLKREDDWIRKAHMTMFENNSLIINQRVGIQVSGTASAYLPVKSLKVNAGLEYDNTHDKLILNNLNNNQSTYKLTNINEYNSLRLRVGYQDVGNGNIRTSLLSRLAMESNFEGYSNNKKAIMFLNGKFYAVVDIQENYSDSFIKERFDLPDKTGVEKYKGSEKDVFEESGISSYFKKDLDAEKSRELLEKYVDVNELLEYYAINILSNNTDWLNKNYEIWKYVGKKDSNNKYLDNRYHFLIFDADLTYYLKENELWDKVSTYIFESLLDEKDSVFKYLLSSDYYKNMFLTIIQDLLNTSFNEKNINKIIDEEYEILKPYINDFYSEELLSKTSEGIELLKKGVNVQNQRVEETISKLDGSTHKYNFKIATGDCAIATWNQMTIMPNEIYENQYYNNTSFSIKLEALNNCHIVGYKVNGKEINENTITISKSLRDNNNMIDIEVITEKDHETELIISEISAKSDSDWMKFTNASDHTINLKKYFISDNIEKITKYNLPDINLESGKSIIINGKKNYFAIGDYICNFNLNNTEELYLYNIDKNEIVDKIAIPRMNSLETYGRYLNSNIYMFYDNSDNERKK